MADVHSVIRPALPKFSAAARTRVYTFYFLVGHKVSALNDFKIFKNLITIGVTTLVCFSTDVFKHQKTTQPNRTVKKKNIVVYTRKLGGK